MLSGYERAELKAMLQAVNKAWRSAPNGAADAAHLAYERALDLVEVGLRTMLAHDADQARGAKRTVVSRAELTAAKAQKRRTVALEMIAARPRSLRALLPVLKRNRCSCAPGDLGRELRTWEKAGLIVCDVKGKRGGARWRIV